MFSQENDVFCCRVFRHQSPRRVYSARPFQPSSGKGQVRKWQKARFPRIKVHRGRILPLYLPMHGVPAMSWTKLSRVSRAFTVSDVSLLCMLPRLVLDEVHHVTLLVYLVFALSREQTRGRLASFDKNSPQLTMFIVFYFDNRSAQSIRS